MIKTISDENGYSLFFEKKKGKINCTAYQTECHMTVKELSDTLNVSTITVRLIVTKAVAKIYFKLKRMGETPFDIMKIMVGMFNVRSEKQYNKLFDLFSERIQKEIYLDAREIFNY